MCWFCTEEAKLHPEESIEVASVRWDHHYACGFHAWFYYRDKPARLFVRELISA